MVSALSEFERGTGSIPAAPTINYFNIILLNFLFWWLGAMETPVPIPNTEVKRGSGDDTLQWGK